MANATDDLLDRVVRHQVLIEKFKTSELPKLIAQLNALDADLLAQLSKAEPASYAGRRLAGMIAAVVAISDEAAARYAAALNGTLEAFGSYESGWTVANLAQAMGAEVVVNAALNLITPDANMVKAAIYSRPLQGKLLKDWVSDLAAARRSRLAAAIRMAVIEQSTIGQLVQRIMGTKANDYRDGILNISRTGANALARTAVQHVSTEARKLSYDANQSVISEVQWVATLDGRTTPYCRAMDGKRFPLDSGPRPPAHINALAAGTMVVTASGEVPIESIRPGDMVLTHRGRFRPVYAVVSKTYEKPYLRRIYLESGRMLRTTDEHPILCRSLGWQHAHQLKVGDELFEKPEQVPEGVDRAARRTALIEEPHDYPFLLDKHEVFSSVSFAPRGMAPAVDFQTELYGGDGEVENARSDDVLMDELRLCPPEQLDQLGFRFGRRGTKRNLLCRAHRGGGSGVARRVGGGHALAVAHQVRVVGLRAASVVVRCATALCGGIGPSKTRTLPLASRFNSGDAAQTVQRPVAPSPLPFDFADRLARAEVLARNDLSHAIPVHVPTPDCWNVQRITLIAFERAVSRVFDISVAEDETFIAEGVIVRNCRSTTVPVLKSWADIGIDAGDIGEGTRASMNGQVPDTLTYDGWLRKQSPEFQDEVLGKAKADLFRGGLTMDKFVDLKSQHEFTLDELRQREPDAWRAAHGGKTADTGNPGGLGEEVPLPTGRKVIIIHGGSAFDVLDPAKLGTGEPGNIRPLGRGLYGYAITADNPADIAAALASARNYAEKYGKGEKALHVFSVNLDDAVVSFNGAEVAALRGVPPSPGQTLVREAYQHANSLPRGPERIAAFDKAQALAAKYPDDAPHMRAEKLPGGLIEVSVHDLKRLQRVGSFPLDAPESAIEAAVTSQLAPALREEQTTFGVTVEQANTLKGQLAPNENGLLVGAREIIGSGSSLPLKLGDHGSFAAGETAVRRYMAAAEQDIHTPGEPGSYEHMVALDVATGNVLWRTTDNVRNSVNLPPTLMDEYTSRTGSKKTIDLWHNHPSAMSPLSTQDMLFTMHIEPVRQIVAHDALGNIFRGEAPHFADTTARDAHLNWLHFGHRQWMAEFEKAIPDFDELHPVTSKLPLAWIKGTLYKDQAHFGFANHLSWRLMDELGFLKYRYETVGALKEMDAIFDQVLKEEGLTLLDFAREFFDPKTVAAQLEFAARTKALYL